MAAARVVRLAAKAHGAAVTRSFEQHAPEYIDSIAELVAADSELTHARARHADAPPRRRTRRTRRKFRCIFDEFHFVVTVALTLPTQPVCWFTILGA
jgi:hypothetical protein